jgi:hypothetical protein
MRDDFSLSSTRRKILYIEGFSPGPGLPFPLLRQLDFDVIKARMPYDCADHLKNPFGVLLVATMALSIWGASFVGVWWGVIKRLAVKYCLDSCVRAYSLVLKSQRIDVVIGYSWGGGIACALLNRGLWEGPTLLIAPAGEQMWAHAGIIGPTLKEGFIAITSKTITVHGDGDAIVPLIETQRLHQGSLERQCRLIIAPDEDHFLKSVVNQSSLSKWISELLE